MNPDQKPKIRVPVISSTHYDREWRFSLQYTRASLVDLMDNLLEILGTRPDFQCYHLDSQGVIIEDYLSLRPEKAEEIRARLAEERLGELDVKDARRITITGRRGGSSRWNFLPAPERAGLDRFCSSRAGGCGPSGRSPANTLDSEILLATWLH